MFLPSYRFLLSSTIFLIWQHGIESRHVHRQHDPDGTDSLAQGRDRRGVERGRSAEGAWAGQGSGVWTWEGDGRQPTSGLLQRTDNGHELLTVKEEEKEEVVVVEEEEGEEDVGRNKVADDYDAVHPDRRSDPAKASTTTDVIHATDVNAKESSLPTDLKYTKTAHTEQLPSLRPSHPGTLPDTVPRTLNAAVHAHRNRRGGSQNSPYLSRAQRQQEEKRPAAREGEETKAPSTTDHSNEDSTIAGPARVKVDPADYDYHSSDQKTALTQQGDADQQGNSTTSVVEKEPGKGVKGKALYTTIPLTRAGYSLFNKTLLDPITDEEKKTLFNELINEWAALKTLLGMRLKRESAAGGGDDDDDDDSPNSDSDDNTDDTELSASGMAEEEDKADAELARMIEQDVPIPTPKNGVKTLSKAEQQDIDEMAYMLTDMELNNDKNPKKDSAKIGTKLNPQLEEEKEFEVAKSGRKRRNSSLQKGKGTLTQKTATEMPDENDVVSAGMKVGTVDNLAENGEKRNTALFQGDFIRKDGRPDNSILQNVQHNSRSDSAGNIHDVSDDHPVLYDKDRFTGQNSEDRKNRSLRDDSDWSNERLAGNEVSKGFHVIKRDSAKLDPEARQPGAKSIPGDGDGEGSQDLPLTIIVHDKEDVELTLPMESKGKRINSKEKSIQRNVLDILRAINNSNRKHNTLTKAAFVKHLNRGNNPDLVNAAHTSVVKREKNKSNSGLNKKVRRKDTNSLISSQGKTINNQLHTQMLTSQTFIIDGKGKKTAKRISLASHLNASRADNTEDNSRNHKRDIRHASNAGLMQPLQVKRGAGHQAKEIKKRESKQNRNEENIQTFSGQPVSELHAAMNNTGAIMARKQSSPETKNRSGMINGNGDTGIQLPKAGRDLNSLNYQIAKATTKNIRPEVMTALVEEAGHTNQDIAGTHSMNTDSVSENEHLQRFGSTGNDNTNNSMAKYKSKHSENKNNATMLRTHLHPPDQMMSDNDDFPMKVQNKLVKQYRNKPNHIKEASDMEPDTKTDLEDTILISKEDPTNQTDQILINQSMYTNELDSRYQHPRVVGVFDQFKQETKSNKAIPVKNKKSSSDDPDAAETTETNEHAETEIHTVGIYSGKDQHHMLKRNAKKKRKKSKKAKAPLKIRVKDKPRPKKKADSAEEELQGSPKIDDEKKAKKAKKGKKGKKGKSKSDKKDDPPDQDSGLLNKIYEHVLNIEKMLSEKGGNPTLGGGGNNLGLKTKEVTKIRAQSIIESEPKLNASDELGLGSTSDKSLSKPNKKNQKKKKGSTDMQDKLGSMDEESPSEKSSEDGGEEQTLDMEGLGSKKKNKKSKSGKKGNDLGGDGLGLSDSSDMGGLGDGGQLKEDEDSNTKPGKKPSLGGDDEETDPMKPKKGSGDAKGKTKDVTKSVLEDAFGTGETSEQSFGEDSEKDSDKKPKDLMNDDLEDELGAKKPNKNAKAKKKGDKQKKGSKGKKEGKPKNNVQETVVFQKVPRGTKKVTKKIVEEDIILEDNKAPKKKIKTSQSNTTKARDDIEL